MNTRENLIRDLNIVRGATLLLTPLTQSVVRESLDRIELTVAAYFRMTEIIEAAKHSAFADRYASSSTKMNPLDYHINAGNPIEGIDDTRDDPTYASNLDLESAVDDTGRDESDYMNAQAEPEPSPDTCFCCGTVYSDEDRSHLMVAPQDFKCPNPRCSSNPA